MGVSRRQRESHRWPDTPARPVIEMKACLRPECLGQMLVTDDRVYCCKHCRLQDADRRREEWLARQREAQMAEKLVELQAAVA